MSAIGPVCCEKNVAGTSAMGFVQKFEVASAKPLH